MDIFKKRKQENEPEAARPQTQVQPPAPVHEAPVQQARTALPESEQLAVARQRAEEQIRQIEQRISHERENLSQKVKSKEEESIGLKARLDMLINQAEQERVQRENQLNLLERQIQRDLAETEKDMENEIRDWNEQSSLKEKELEETKHQSIFMETQKKIESEQNIRSLQTTLEQIEAKYRHMERQLLEEQGQWIARIKGKEEEIMNLRTQISLRETQMRLEDEKSRSAKTEMETAWQEQSKELASKLERRQAEWARVYREKEEELIALRAGVERRLSDMRIETEKKEKEIGSLRRRIEERIASVETALAEERGKWQELLKNREEEFKRLKAGILLQESQEKAEREQKQQEFREAESAANKRLKDIRQKIEEEKENWTRSIGARDEELKVFKIQAEIKLKELHDAWEKRKAGAEQEKNNLMSELAALESTFREEKRNAQKEVEVKNAEIVVFQKERQEQQARLLGAEQQALAELKKRKESLEKELSDIEENFTREKTHWQEIVGQKEKEAASYRNELAARESSINRDIAALDMQLRGEQGPALKQAEDLKIKIKEFRRHAAEELLRKETQKKTLTEQYRRQEETIRQRMSAQAEKIETAEKALAQKAADVRAQIEEQSRQAQAVVERLEAEEAELIKALSSEKDKADAAKKKVTELYEAENVQLRRTLEELEKEYIETEGKLNLEVSAKTREHAREEQQLHEIEENGRASIAAKEQELAALKERGEQETAALTEELKKLKNDTSKKIAEKERAIIDMRQAMKENESRLAAELDVLERELKDAVAPLEARRDELKGQLARVRRDAEEKIARADAGIEALKTQQAEKEADFAATIETTKEKLSREKDNLKRAIETLQEERSQAEADFARNTLIKEEQHKALEKEIAGRIEYFAAEHDRERRAAGETVRQLKEAIAGLEQETVRIEKEYPQALSAKQEEITALEKQIRQREAFYNDQQQQAEKGLENFQHRAERRLAQTRLALSQLGERLQAETSLLEDKMNALRADMEQKEKTVQNEFAREGKIFAEEKYKLEKQKSALEEKFKDLQMTSREQLRVKEKEILALEGELAEKERTWEHSWKQKEQELSAERAILTQELEAVSARLKEEEALAHRRISEKENEIAHFQEQSAARLENLTADTAEKKRVWEEANGRLSEQVASLTASVSDLTKTWETVRATKDKELSVLKSNLEFWELRAKTEEEKRLAAWEDERHALETNIKDTEQAVVQHQKDAAALMEEKTARLASLRGMAAQSEEEKQTAWKETETRLVQERERLTAEVASWEKTIKDESSKIEKERKEMDREIERLKLESALKDTTTQSERHKAEREWRRMKHKLEERMSALARQLTDEREAWVNKLKLKEEECKTLEVRLGMREERRRSEIKRRQDEIEKVVSELAQELKALEDNYNKEIPSSREAVEARRGELAFIKKEMEEKERLWNEEQAAKQDASAGMYAAIDEDLALMEQELKSESKRMEQLFDVKAKQIEHLGEIMAKKEEALMRERERTQRLAVYLRAKTDEFRRHLRQSVPAEKGAGENAVPLFEEAIKEYNGGRYDLAKDKLAQVLRIEPRFAGAFQYLALCAYNSGNRQEARAMAERALELEPENENIKQWISTIERSEI